MSEYKRNWSPRQRTPMLGTRWGRLTVIGEAPSVWHPNGKPSVAWECKCDCGTVLVVLGNSLRRGNTQSCGCFQSDRVVECKTTHGHAATGHGGNGTPTYRSWRKMLSRCSNPKDTHWHNYGGRGITVCERWHTFENFLADMGELPTDKHSIDRYPNNNGNYEPGNCRWATHKEQMRNRRNTVYVTIGEVTASLAEWAERSGFKHGTLRGRLLRGVKPEDLLAPIRSNGK